MHVDALSVLSLFMAAPFAAMVAILIVYNLQRIRWLRTTRVGRLFGVQTSAVGLGMAFLFLQSFWQPSLAPVIEIRQQADAEEDDEVEPDTVAKQLRRIRRGEPVERLVLRL
jgi:hypothetical protein